MQQIGKVLQGILQDGTIEKYRADINPVNDYMIMHYYMIYHNIVYAFDMYVYIYIYVC